MFCFYCCPSPSNYIDWARRRRTTTTSSSSSSVPFFTTSGGDKRARGFMILQHQSGGDTFYTAATAEDEDTSTSAFVSFCKNNPRSIRINPIYDILGLYTRNCSFLSSLLDNKAAAVIVMDLLMAGAWRPIIYRSAK